MKKIKKPNLKLNQTLTLYIMLIILIISVLVTIISTIINVINQNLFNNQGTYTFLIIGLTIILVVSIIISYFLGRFLNRLTSTIRNALKEISNGNFNVQFKETKNKYINEIITDFNNMVKDLNSVPMLRNDFVSNFSHEFKTPIASIKGFAEILKNKDTLTNEEKKEYFNIIIEECTRLSNLTTNTLLISKLDTQQKLNNTESIHLDEQIYQCLFLFENQLKEKKIKLEVNLQPTVFIGDSDLLQQVWINLISNAIKFTKNLIEINLVNNKNNIIITIKDNGIGVPQESLKHVFEKFYQVDSSRSEEGTGLGLAIVKRIINLHGGNIKITSILGQFTEFRIVLKSI